MKVVLTRKLADCIDGIDIALRRVGDVLDLLPADAALLVAENWATLDRRRERGAPPVGERRRPTFESHRHEIAGALDRAS
jgi:hypothetical protein